MTLQEWNKLKPGDQIKQLNTDCDSIYKVSRIYNNGGGIQVKVLKSCTLCLHNRSVICLATLHSKNTLILSQFYRYDIVKKHKYFTRLSLVT